MQELIDYSKYHFAYEEKLLRDISYPKIESHIECHKKFIEKITTLLNL